MTWQAWVTLGTIAVVLVLLTKERYPASIVVLGSVVVLMIIGVIDAPGALQGFSNPAPITVAALYVVARGIEVTGALQPIVSTTLGEDGGKRGVLPRLLLPVAGASAFLNNTPIVAMLVPQVTNWANRNKRSPSTFLLPLSYAALFGGMVTLVGTSTNLLVSGLLEAQGYEPIGMFELSRIGLPIAVVGVLLIVVLAPRLLEERIPPREALRRGAREFVVTMDVETGGSLDGKAVESGGLRHLHGVFLVQVDRQGETFAPVGPDMELKGGDRLTFVGRADDVVDLHATRGLVSTEHDHMMSFDSPRHTFWEAVIGPTSPLFGRTLKEIGFRGRYQAAALAIHRAGHQLRQKLGGVRLRSGDTLLLLGDSGFGSRWRDRSDFLLISRLGGRPPAVTKKAWLAILIAAAVIVLAGVGVLPILHLAIAGAMLLVVTGVLTAGEARNSVDMDVILVIAGGFGLGAAVLDSGLGDAVAGLIHQALGQFGPRAELFGLLLATVLLKSVITNNAAAVLMFPIFIATAHELALDPRQLAIGLAIVSSASFLTPIAYQTNLMVWGPGGYRLRDYLRLGVPLVVWVMAAVTFFLPGTW